MDVFVLLIFGAFFAALTVAATANGGLLRASMRRPRLFQAVAVAAGTVLVPLDLSVAAYGTIGGGQSTLADLAARLLLLNVAASCGIAALHGYLRRPGFAPAGGRAVEPALRLGVLGWVGPLVALIAVVGMALLGQLRNHATITAVGPVWAFYSVLICVISAYALLRQRAREAIDPQEG